MRIIRVVAVSCVAVALAVPAAAHAGTYEVAICHDPGTALGAPTDGMSFPIAGAYADAGIYQGCAGGGYVYAALDGLVAHGPSDAAAWRFTAPPGTLIDGAAFWRSFYAGTSVPFASPIDTVNTIAPDGAIATLAACAQTYDCTQIGGANLASASFLGFGGLGGAAAIQGDAACGGGQSCPAGGIPVCPELGTDPCMAANELYAMVVTLDDASAPLTSGVTGSLTGAGVLSGPAQLTFDATDTGSGLYTVSALIDGHLAEQVPFDSDGGRCASLGDGDGPALRFDWAVPCVLSGADSLTLETSSLADGSHDVQVSVQDAAGNSSPVWSGTILTRNAPQGGTPQISGTPQVGRTLTAATGAWAPAPRLLRLPVVALRRRGGRLRPDRGSDVILLRGARRRPLWRARGERHCHRRLRLDERDVGAGGPRRRREWISQRSGRPGARRRRRPVARGRGEAGCDAARRARQVVKRSAQLRLRVAALRRGRPRLHAHRGYAGLQVPPARR